MSHHKESEFPETEFYGDPGIASNDAKVPKWLLWTYAVLPVWGIYAFFMYWNGSYGWLDRGYWEELQKAANTTFPQVNYIQVEKGRESPETDLKPMKIP